MKTKKEQEEISIIINNRNLEDLEFKFIRKGITIIIGENDVGKSNILDYMYYNNEEWDGFSEHVEEFKKAKICYKMPLLFSKNFRVLCPEHEPSLKKEEKEKLFQNCQHSIKCSREKLHVEFWVKHASYELRRELREENIIHDEKTDISWFPHDLEVFLDIDEKDPHVVSKELNIISNLEFAVDNLDEEEIAGLRELALKVKAN